MESKGYVLMYKYELGRLLGQGTFAKVYFAKDIKNGRSVAIKMVDKEKVMKVGLVNQIKREICVMRLIKHPNIVQFYEVIATKSKIYFVMEYAKGGELFNKVAKGKLKEDVSRKYFQQLISAVDFCHSRDVYHRDLKPENLLLDEIGNLKVSDFGLSALAESKRQDGLLHTTCGTPAYVAPEVISRKGYDGAKADVWSCGVILFVLLAGYLPFHDSNLIEMYKKIEKAEYRCPSWFPSDVKRLLSKILEPDLNNRISTSRIMENSWFKKGLDTNPVKEEVQRKGKMTVSDSYEVVGICESSSHARHGTTKCGTSNMLNTHENTKIASLNAFDIIALSSGFNLSNLFEHNNEEKEARFTSKLSATAIISKLEDIAKRLRLKVTKKGDGLLMLEGIKPGRKGVLSIDAKIFELLPSFHLIEVKKTNGDTVEYGKLWKQDIRPSLSDIVCTWLGENQ